MEAKLPDTVYKIQNRQTGKFSKGGIYLSYCKNASKHGKIWASLNAFSNHLNLFINGLGSRKLRIFPEKLDVVEYELVEKSRQPLNKWYELYKGSKADGKSKSVAR